jgi:putative ABC transport system permease protein
VIKYYFKTAWQNIIRQGSTSAINITGLSIGMAAAFLIFIWVKNELTFDNYHTNAKQIFLIKNLVTVNKKDTWVWEESPYLLGEYAKQQLPEVLKVCRIRPMIYDAIYFNIKGHFTKEESCAYIDPEWLNVFKYEFIYGSKADFNNHPFSLLLTASKAKKYFGNEDPIGKIIRIDTMDYQVRGVIKDNPTNSSFQYDAFIPIKARFSNPKVQKGDESWGNFYYLTFLKLRPSADAQIVSEKLKEIIATQRDQNNLKINLIPLQDLRFENDLQNSAMQHRDKKSVYIFSILGVLLLLSACINYVNLTTAQATVRAKEVSIKKIVGAEKRQLFAQFISESALISAFALVVSLIIVALTLPIFNKFTDERLSLSFTSPGIWIITGGTLLITILLNSIYPAVLLSSFNPISIFRGKNVLQMKDAVLRKGLVIIQFTISVSLVVATIIIYKQLQFINRQNASYNRSQVLSFSIPFKLLRQYENDQRIRLTGSFKKELLTESNIDDVSLINMESIINTQAASAGTNTDWNGRDKDFNPPIAFFNVDTSFKRIINLQMKEGRWYETGNMADQHNSILNETAVKEFNIHKPVIGQRFISRGDTGVVIGIVKDFYYKSMHEKIGPVVIRTMDDYNITFLVKTTPGKLVEAKNATEKVWKRFFPSEPFSFNFLNDEFEKLYRTDQKISLLIWLFSFIAVFISGLGLFGLTAFAMERRKKEIGVRKILGASVFSIFSLLSKELIYMVLFSLLIAFPLAFWVMNKWLENFVYRINIEWWIFLIAALLAMTVSLMTVGYQAIRAATANPMKSLRTE